MKYRRLAGTALAAATLFAGTTTAASASPAGSSDSASSSAAPASCRISVDVPYYSAGRIKGYGEVDCTATVYAIQAQIWVQRKSGGRFFNVGSPARGTKYYVTSVWGTASVGYAPGIYRTSGNAKVKFFAGDFWHPIRAVSPPVRG